MYGNMTREEMIQRLYEGNFTTGELERQLIAKLFEGGSDSSGGGSLVVNASFDGETDVGTLDKTAAEILEASKTMPVVLLFNSEEDESIECEQAPLIFAGFGAFDGPYVMYDFRFFYFAETPSKLQFYAVDGSDYPTTQKPNHN